ncbi:unnamed protein product [Choristocarpus tenellus]
MGLYMGNQLGEVNMAECMSSLSANQKPEVTYKDFRRVFAMKDRSSRSLNSSLHKPTQNISTSERLDL